jgi:hypothetical protein
MLVNVAMLLVLTNLLVSPRNAPPPDEAHRQVVALAILCAISGVGCAALVLLAGFAYSGAMQCFRTEVPSHALFTTPLLSSSPARAT